MSKGTLVKDKNKKTGNKKIYETPKVTSEKIYEINALKCGKCQTSKSFQFACTRSSKTS